VGLAVLGRQVGSSWQSWRHNLEYVDYIGLALVIAVIAYLILRRRGGGGDAAPDVAA
jgi:membrane protein DedA with SNARE-associated domain